MLHKTFFARPQAPAATDSCCWKCTRHCRSSRHATSPSCKEVKRSLATTTRLTLNRLLSSSLCVGNELRQRAALEVELWKQWRRWHHRSSRSNGCSGIYQVRQLESQQLRSSLWGCLCCTTGQQLKSGASVVGQLGDMACWLLCGECRHQIMRPSDAAAVVLNAITRGICCESSSHFSEHVCAFV